jgi:hypothetical protein
MSDNRKLLEEQADALLRIDLAEFQPGIDPDFDSEERDDPRVNIIGEGCAWIRAVPGAE